MSDQSEKKTDFELVREMDAPLSVQLSHYSDSVFVRNRALAEAYQRLVEFLIRGKAGAGAPRSGDRLPQFTLTDENGHIVTLASLLDQGPLVVSFNRGHWCPFCWLELSALQDRYDEIRRHGAEVISITPETAAYSKGLKSKLGLRFPVLTDLDNAYAMELGLAMALTDEIKTLLMERGRNLNIYQKNDAWFIPLPATFLVNQEGIIERAYTNPDYRQRMDPDVLLDWVSALD